MTVFTCKTKTKQKQKQQQKRKKQNVEGKKSQLNRFENFLNKY